MVTESPLHAPYHADALATCGAIIVENEPLARDTLRVRLDCSAIAQAITPGQFVMLRLHGWNDPLIGRPFALYDVHTDTATGEDRWLDIVYLVKGKFTQHLATQRPGETLDIWGPLGNGFLPQATEHLIMVAGGIGQTPMLALAQEMLGRKQYGRPRRQVAPAQRVTLCYGARSAAYFAGLDSFSQLGVELQLSTDDGSRGHAGLVTDLLRETLATSHGAPRVVCCGPERMMEAVAHVCQAAGVPCEVSLETPMACGIGICYTCVAMVRDADGGWDYKRTCVEGPVFPAEKIVWE
jgi:dihydroorotate dehydrogenase electron transfer subunit